MRRNIFIGTIKVFIIDHDFVNLIEVKFRVQFFQTINSTGSGSSKSILDTPIYNGSGALGTAGVNSLAVIGRVNSSYSSGRLLMSFPGLMKKDFMNNPNYVIESAELHMSEVSGKSANAEIGAHLYMGGSSWSESSLYRVLCGMEHIKDVERRSCLIHVLFRIRMLLNENLRLLML